MGFFEIFMIGVGLSMDAFAASVCKGLNMRRMNIKNMLVIGLFFGGFQALMPAVGWVLGKQFENYITSVDHWVAFALLVFIGGKMIYDVFEDKDIYYSLEGYLYPNTYYFSSQEVDVKEIFTLAIATSIDALAVGISFAFLQVDIVKAASVIGITTFLLSAAGVAVGNIFGAKYEKKATLAGGIILVLIGLKILLEHMGVLG